MAPVPLHADLRRCLNSQLLQCYTEIPVPSSERTPGIPQYTTDTLREPMRVVVFRHYVLVTEYSSNRILVLTPNYEKPDELLCAGPQLKCSEQATQSRRSQTP